MRILIVNKFLYPNGGSETYIFKLGQYLVSIGHEVQYFGMEHEGRIVGNRIESYTSDMNFHSHSLTDMLLYPIKTIYSFEAGKKLRMVLSDFKPDVVHLNNFNYQLTPSIIVETVAWRKKYGKDVKIVYTAHDYQLICPNHMCNNPNIHKNCEKCLGDGKSGKYGKGHYLNCILGKCIHGSTAKSLIGAMEAMFWQWRGIYRYVDKIICCSEFLKEKMDSNPLFRDKTVTMHNFVDKVSLDKASTEEPVLYTLPEKYVLYFGRYSVEKGVGTLLEVVQELPDVNFVFAGTGSLEIPQLSNLTNLGFQEEAVLKDVVKKALFTILPAEWNEPFGLTVIESQMQGTPALGSRIGGITEIIEDGITGKLFESASTSSLKNAIKQLWNSAELLQRMSENCLNKNIETTASYTEKLLKIYSGGGIA